MISVIFTKKIQRKALVEGIPSKRPSFLGFGCPALCLNGHASLSLCSQPIRAQYLLGSRPMSVAPLCLAGAAMLMFWKVRPYKSPGPLLLSSGLLQGGTASIMILKCMWVGLGSSTLMFLKTTVEPPEPWPLPLMFQTEPPAEWWNLDLA